MKPSRIAGITVARLPGKYRRTAFAALIHKYAFCLAWNPRPTHVLYPDFTKHTQEAIPALPLRTQERRNNRRHRILHRKQLAMLEPLKDMQLYPYLFNGVPLPLELHHDISVGCACI